MRQLFTFILFGFSISAYSQTLYTIKFVDESTNEGIENANLIIGENKDLTRTNFLGYAQVNTKAENITFTHVSYESSLISLNKDIPSFIVKVRPKQYDLGLILIEDDGKYFDEKPKSLDSLWAKNTATPSSALDSEKPAILRGGINRFAQLFSDQIDLKNVKGITHIYFSVDPNGLVLVDSIDTEMETASMGNVLEKISEWVPAHQWGKPFASKFKLSIAKYDEKVYLQAEKSPVFPGGEREFYKNLADNLSYPAEARRSGQQGEVWVSFIIEQDGKICTIEVEQSVGFGLDQEVVRVLKATKFKSGAIKNNEPVRIRRILPVRFILGNEKPLYYDGIYGEEFLNLVEVTAYGR